MWFSWSHPDLCGSTAQNTFASQHSVTLIVPPSGSLKCVFYYEILLWWPHMPHTKKKGISVCLCMCASNFSADQDQTDLCGSRVCNVALVWTTMIPFINYFRNALRIPLVLLTIATIVTRAPEPITAHHSHVCTRANHCRAHPHDIP